jgi:hypothetical protein
MSEFIPLLFRSMMAGSQHRTCRVVSTGASVDFVIRMSSPSEGLS